MKKLFLHEKSFTILITCFYIFGIFSTDKHIELFCAFLALILLNIALFYLKYDFKKVIILYLLFFLGIIRCNYNTLYDNKLSNINSNNVILQGRIISSDSYSTENKRVKFNLKVNYAKIQDKELKNINSKLLVSIDLKDKYNQQNNIGNFVEIKGKLRPPICSKNPYQFNYKKYLRNNYIDNVLYSDENSIKIIKKVKPNKNLEDNWYYILNKFECIRNEVIQKHSMNIKSPYLEILGGLVFGNETINPDEKIKESFINSGLLHLLAASGLNVALIYGIWWWFARIFHLPYTLSILIGAVFVIFYTFMTGFPPSILRASLMLLFVLFGKLIDRNANSIALVFFVGFLILFFNPKMLYDIGFQLSFVVTIGLIICCPVVIEKFEKYDKKFKEKNKNKSYILKYVLFLFSPVNIISAILIPLVAQLWVIPLQIHYFNNFAPLSVLANIAVIPFIGILSFVGFVSSIVALIPKYTAPVVYIFDLIAKPLLYLLVKISEFFASFKYSLITTVSLNSFQIFSFWVVILLLTLNIKYEFKNKKHIIALLTLIIIFLLSFIQLDKFSNNLEIIMFDVGNADSFLIKTNTNKYIIIDTGGKTYKSISSAKGIINPYLRNKLINNIDTLIITHFDIDHCGGALDIMKSFNVKNVIIQKDEAKSQHSKEILQYLKENNINYKIVKNNEVILNKNNLKLTTFKADNLDIKNQDKLDNESSIILLLEYKNENMLFMADSGTVGYEKIKEKLPKIKIIKVGHHGAKDVLNKNMLQNLSPEYALISTGINKFNHPHYSTIELLEDNDVKVISTKNYGFVKITIKNDKIDFYHFDNNKIKPIEFDKKEEIPFHKTKFVQNFIKENQ